MNNNIKQTKRKRYERKTTSDDSSMEFAGCIVYFILMMILGVMIFADLISREVLQMLVFAMTIIKVIQHFYYKYN